MPKILFLDTWDVGYRNFTRLNNEFISKGFSTLLVHTGSYLKPQSYLEKSIDGLKIRDIAYYKTMFIKKVITIEKPDVVLILNLSFIFDRAIINLTKQAGIKSVFLAHGKLIDPDAALDGENNLNKTIKGKISRIFRKKNLLVLLNYVSSLKSYQRITKLFRTLSGTFINPAQFLTFPRYNNELDADLILLYTAKDRDLYVNHFHFPSSKVKVVGNPEISSFVNEPLLTETEIKRKYIGKETGDYALYLDDGLANVNMWMNDQWYEHLLEVKELARNSKMELVVKLHPRIGLQEHQRFFDENGIRAFGNVDFKNIIYYSKVVISHFSSTIIYALLYNKPILSPRWDLSTKFPLNYPPEIVSYCSTPVEFGNQLLSPQVNISAIKKYLMENDIDPEINSIKLIVDEISGIIL